jgi:shikimate dehydrogenase
MKYLDHVDLQAVEVGAVNTVVNEEGVLTGYNTDGAGALAVLREENVKLTGQKVVLLGAGGAAKALAYSIAPLADSLVILNRSEAKAQRLASSLNARVNTNTVGKKLTETAIRCTLADADVLINATSVGMYPKINDTLVTRETIRPETTVFDIVYNPLNTRLLKEAEAAGAHVIGGLKMLVYQGARTFELWTGRKPPVDEMYDAVERALKRGSHS